MTLTKALKKLYYAITGESVNRSSYIKVINDLADNWPTEFPTTTELPTYAVADAGKVLSVNSSGELEWIIPE